jgi:hypothetical protein
MHDTPTSLKYDRDLNETGILMRKAPLEKTRRSFRRFKLTSIRLLALYCSQLFRATANSNKASGTTTAHSIEKYIIAMVVISDKNIQEIMLTAAQ